MGALGLVLALHSGITPEVLKECKHIPYSLYNFSSLCGDHSRKYLYFIVKDIVICDIDSIYIDNAISAAFCYSM